MQKGNFSNIIEQFTDKKPSKTYNLPSASSALNIEEEDKETFKSLFNFSHNKGIGNGETSIYWLFSPNSQTNHGGHNADLIVHGNKCEIKSYPDHFAKVPLGKWKSDRKSRYTVNSLFAYSNIISTPSEFLSETTFNIEHLKNSYDVLLNTSKTLQSHQDIPYIDKIYNRSLEILSYVTGSSSDELAKNLVVQILETKFIKKPGDLGYVINLIPTDPMNIYIHNLDLKKLHSLSYDDLKDNFDVQSNEIRVNYKIFELDKDDKTS